MNLIGRAGRFKMRATAFYVGEKGPNKLTTVTVEFELLDEYLEGQWRPVDAGVGITAWFYLEKKDGAVNTTAVDQLKAAYGWDGADPFWLEDTDLSEVVVQVDVKAEEYQGKTQMKVKWLHAGDSDPDKSDKKSDETTRKNVLARLGPKLRALAGNTAPTEKPVVGSLADAPYEAFCAACPKTWNKQRIDAEWFNVLAKLFQDKTPKRLTREDWLVFMEKFKDEIVPF